MRFFFNVFVLAISMLAIVSSFHFNRLLKHDFSGNSLSKFKGSTQRQQFLPRVVQQNRFVSSTALQLFPQVVFIASCVAAIVGYIYNNIDSIREQQRVAVEKTLRNQDENIRSAQNQQQNAIAEAQRKQQEAIKKAQLKQQQDINSKKP